MRHRHWLSKYLQLGFVGILGWLGVSAFASKAFAQSNIVPDDTLGAESSQVRSNYQGLPTSAEAITGGATRGVNLFHSFQEFNVAEKRGAYFFSSNASIQNILARVTGKNHSEILGTLGTFGRSRPNLFLINPNGIVFGENASLNVGGSFVATTANAIKFGENGSFSVSNPQMPSQLLKINPSALIFNQINIASIQNNASKTGLQVPDGRSLLLVGGNVIMNGGRLTAPRGRIEVGGVAGVGTVSLNVDGSNLGLIFPDNVVRANISLSNGSKISSLSTLNDYINTVLYTQNGIYNKTKFSNSELLIIIVLLFLGWQNEELAYDNNINLQAQTISMKDDPVVVAGNVNINVLDSLIMTNGSVVQAGTNISGNKGNINIQARNTVSLAGGSMLLTASDRAGNSGNVTIKAGDTVLFDGVSSRGNHSGINASVHPGELVGVTGIFKLTFPKTSQAGDIKIETGSLVIVNDGGIFSNLQAERVGKGGNIEIIADSVTLTNGGQISARNIGQGSAGSITINTNGLINVANSDITTNASQSSGGNITLKAKDIRLLGDSNITTFVDSGAGGGGNITLAADSILAFDDIDILTFAQDGKGGDITFNTRAFFGQNYRPASLGTDLRTLDGNSRVDINATGAVSGVISLPDTSFIQNSFNELPQNPIDTNALLANSCIARRNHQQQGTFFITGSGSLPERPGDAPLSSFPIGGMQNISKDGESTTSRRPWTLGDPIVEPQGVYRLANGQRVLSRECP